MRDTPRVVIRQPAFEKEDVTREVENLLLWHSGANLPSTLAEIEMLVHEAAQRSAGGGRRFLISRWVIGSCC